MNEKSKIERLWHYLQIQDELLVIQVQNTFGDTDEYLIVENINNELQINTANNDDVQDLFMKKNLRIIRQRDETGKYIIPDVEQIIHDKEVDY